MNYAYVTYIRRYKKEQEYGIQYNVKVKSSSSRAVITFDLRNPRRCQKKKKREHPQRTCNQPSFPNRSSPARARPGVTCPSALPEFLKPSCLLSTSSWFLDPFNGPPVMLFCLPIYCFFFVYFLFLPSFPVSCFVGSVFLFILILLFYHDSKCFPRNVASLLR